METLPIGLRLYSASYTSEVHKITDYQTFPVFDVPHLNEKRYIPLSSL